MDEIPPQMKQDIHINPLSLHSMPESLKQRPLTKTEQLVIYAHVEGIFEVTTFRKGVAAGNHCICHLSPYCQVRNGCFVWPEWRNLSGRLREK